MIKEITKQINKANIAYRIGKPIMSDSEYDSLIEELSILDPDNDILSKIGHQVQDESRKTKLDIIMASMVKKKTITEVNDWVRLKGISTDEFVIITPKFDGLSLCVEEEIDLAITRGDGVYGQRSDAHYSFIKNHLQLNPNPFQYTYGEVMMPKQIFIDKYSMDFANPRNLVAGLLNSKTVDESLKSSLSDCNYIKYGAIQISNIFKTKQEIIDQLNIGQEVKVNYHICQIKDLNEELLISLFHTIQPNYEIDGLIIEINDITLQNKLGRETSSNNPSYAIAFKHSSFEQSSESEVLGITWNISKQGLLKPIIHINPIRLDGVTVSNVTGNNAKFVKDMGIGVGAIVKVLRSGMVIPKIVDIIKKVEFQMPEIKDVEIGWNDNGIELITIEETDQQRLKQIISFFEILEADNVGEGVLTQLWNSGYRTIKDILELTINDLIKIDRFGSRKAFIVYNSIQSKIKDVELSKLQHATGIFKGLGSRKLILLEHFTEKPTIEQVIEIDGFAEKSANSYIEGYDKFNDFIKDLPITIKSKEKVIENDNNSSDNTLEGMVFVFTGVRRKDLEIQIEDRGGRIASSVSKNTTHVICKDPGSGSLKLVKAQEFGAEIMSVEELEEFLN